MIIEAPFLKCYRWKKKVYVICSTTIQLFDFDTLSAIAFKIVINHIYLVATITFVTAFAVSTVVIIYKKRFFNYSTLFTCHTILGVLSFSTNHIATCSYIYICDQQTLPKRSYVFHISNAWIHHSFRKLCSHCLDGYFISFFCLPLFVIGNLVEPKIDNLCFVSLSRPDLLFSMSVIAF